VRRQLSLARRQAINAYVHLAPEWRPAWMLSSFEIYWPMSAKFVRKFLR
jgi:hypothetical protein